MPKKEFYFSKFSDLSKIVGHSGNITIKTADWMCIKTKKAKSAFFCWSHKHDTASNAVYVTGQKCVWVCVCVRNDLGFISPSQLLQGWERTPLKHPTFWKSKRTLVDHQMPSIVQPEDSILAHSFLHIDTNTFPHTIPPLRGLRAEYILVKSTQPQSVPSNNSEQ